MSMTEAGGGGNPPLSELQFVMQKLEQMEQGSRALETTVWEMLRYVEEVKKKKEKELYVNTWESNAQPESQDPIARVTAILEKPKITDENQKVKDFLDAKVISVDANEDTYEKLVKHETTLQEKILAFIEKPPKYAGNPKEVFSGVRNCKLIWPIMIGELSQTME